MISRADIAWLAGLLEGEGHFGYMAYTCRVDVWMSDRDVIERAAGLLGKAISQRGTKLPRQKTALYGFTVCGQQAVAVMFMVYGELGRRRREQIRQAITKWRAPKLCHSERSRIASGAVIRGWLTRRRTEGPEEISRKCSEAAQKGWVTRRHG